MHAQYLYDARGQRVKKLVRKQGGQVEVTHYIDAVFEHHRWPPAAENNHVHVMDDQQRIALVRVGAATPGDDRPGRPVPPRRPPRQQQRRRSTAPARLSTAKSSRPTARRASAASRASATGSPARNATKRARSITTAYDTMQHGWGDGSVVTRWKRLTVSICIAMRKTDHHCYRPHWHAGRWDPGKKFLDVKCTESNPLGLSQDERSAAALEAISTRTSADVEADIEAQERWQNEVIEDANGRLGRRKDVIKRSQIDYVNARPPQSGSRGSRGSARVYHSTSTRRVEGASTGLVASCWVD